jgi:hypothetical protein
MHHAIRYCSICGTNGKAEFRRSEVAGKHYLYYDDGQMSGHDKQETEHCFGVPDRSEVRCFLADLLTPVYANYFSFNPSNPPEKYHRIFNSQFAPGTDGGYSHTTGARKAPTIVCAQSYFRYGVTVVLWLPHRTPLFQGPIFPNWPRGMLAVASAKAGIIMEDTPSAPVSETQRLFPNRLIVGIGEMRRSSDGASASRYDAGYMTNNFINKQKGRRKQILNGYHTNWGARLIPVNKCAPEGEQFLRDVIVQGPYYQWSGSACQQSSSPPSNLRWQDDWTGAIQH